MKNREIADLLYEIADILEYNKVEWKPKAYRRAAGTIERLSDDIEEIYREKGKKGLEEIPGVGKSIAMHIAEYLEKGRVEKFEKLRKKSPRGIQELMQLMGLGPSKVKRLEEELGVHDIEGLKKAIEEHKLQKLEGFGEKTEQNLLQSIEQYKKSHERMLLGKAFAIANEIISYMKKDSKVLKIDYAGSLRRMKETIGDIDILAVASDPKTIMETFVKFPGTGRILVHGDTKSSIMLKDGINVDLRIVPPESYGAALQYFTGSKDHNIALRKRAIEMGFKLSEYGLFDKKTGKLAAGNTEKEIYEKLNLSFIPPELRESRGEIEAAEKNNLPKLIELSDVKGDLQVHTKYSDGSNSIEEMSAAAQKLGYEYIAITDHSVSERIARGMDKEKIRKQWKDIEKVSNHVKIIKGAEVDILPDGSLDYPDEILKRLDFVIVAVHSRFKSPEKEMTKRILAALENKYVNALGHPTGRMIGSREPYKADFEKIFEFAARNNKLLEINADPERLDLNDSLIIKAKLMGAKFCLGTDAHSANGLSSMIFGVGQARRGWLTKNDVVNSYPYNQLMEFLRKQRLK